MGYLKSTEERLIQQNDGAETAGVRVFTYVRILGQWGAQVSG
jgi:hypothetical protein